MLVAMDSQQVSILVLLDLSAAFDTVNHDALLKWLKKKDAAFKEKHCNGLNRTVLIVFRW